ncbi:MAG: (Fe-S)-binding protein, partial [Candidatus Sericytochromatia bacterium]|nr:(Fe-S)-binding protein [Candidatus Sericytochromatia bacterium]
MDQFLSIPEKVLLFVAIAVAIYHFTTALIHKIELITLGKNENRFSEVSKRINLFVKYVLLQKRVFKDPVFGTMHAVFFWGFIFITVETFNFIAQGFNQEFHLPLTNSPYFIGIVETVEVLVLVGLAMAFYRRLVLRPNNLSLNRDGLLILSFIGGLMLSALFKDGFEIAMAKTSGTVFFMADAGNYFNPSYIGNAISAGVLSLGLSPSVMLGFHNLFWWTHVSIVLIFLVYIPASKHSHLIASMFTVWFGRTKPYGQLSYIDMDTEMEKDEPSFGVNKFEDFTWRQLLDVYACTECGRCQTQCPAYLSGKPLNPKKIIVDLRHELFYTGEKLILEKAEAKTRSADGVATLEEIEKVAESEPHPLIERVYEKEEIWACTTCLACVQACPVLIEHVDKIVDVRRHLVMMEADMSEQVVLTFNNIENQGNPWG